MECSLMTSQFLNPPQRFASCRGKAKCRKFDVTFVFDLFIVFSIIIHLNYFQREHVRGNGLFLLLVKLRVNFCYRCTRCSG